MTNNDILYPSGYYYPSRNDNMIFEANNIDPILQSHSPSLQKFIQNNQRTSLFNPPTAPHARAQEHCYYTHATSAIQTGPSAPQDRFASPVSSNDPSSAAALSPPGETEASLFDFDLPPTPPDTSLYSQYTNTSHVDSWGAAYNLQFGNMGPICVNPALVNHSQQHEQPEPEKEAFTLERTPSWETDYGTAIAAATASATGQSVGPSDSIQAHIKQEESVSSYPEPSSRSIGDSFHDSDEESQIMALPPKRKAEDEDTDYKPPKKSKSSRAPRSRAMTGPTNTIAPESSSPRRPRRTTTPLNNQAQAPSNPCRLSPQGPFLCREASCSKQAYADQNSLDAHIKKKHTRPFKCVFHFAGCHSIFATKNEWKRHVNTQHLLLNYWICQEADCARLPNGPSPIATNSMSSRSAGGRPAAAHQHSTAKKENIPNGNIFNRKDLYTQHIRRMHMPQHYKKASDSKKGGVQDTQHEWESHLRTLQEAAIRTRCTLPGHMTCPATGCDEEFVGSDAWDARMEHVAKHLDGAARGIEEQVEFGGEEDACLVEWAGRGDVKIIEPVGLGGKWTLSVGCGGSGTGEGRAPAGARRRRDSGGKRVRDEIVVGGEEVDDEDAEGEDEF